MKDLNITIPDNRPGTLILSGKIDTLTSPQLRSALAGMEETAEVTGTVVLDMAEVNYISSSGLRELLIASKKLGSKAIFLDKVTPEVEEIFKVTGFSDIFRYRTKDESLNIRNMSIKDLLKHRVNDCPDRTFVKASGTKYTWADIDRGSSVIAGELHSLGVGWGSHVALCGTNSVNWILTFFAIQKLGAVAVLLNPQLTTAEITTISQLGDITHFCFGNTPVVDRKEFMEQVLYSEGTQITKVFDVCEEIDFLKRPVTEYPVINVNSDDICLMMFTSGSTGTPKGVLLSAWYLFNSSDYCVKNLNMTKEDRLCAILPMFHIFGLTAVLISCVISESLIILPRSSKPDELMNVIKQEKCTILHSVPTVLLRLVNAPGFSSDFVSSIRASYLSGAPVSEAQLEMLMKILPNNHFMRRYGLTEMTPVSSTNLDDDIEHILCTVGKPLAGTDVRIIDMATGSYCPTGVKGEIIVNGSNLMCSYYKLPVDKQPFDENGYLHTGDLGFLDEKGYLHFSGRVKEIIIRGGENIMPNEVASAISMHNSIADVKVIGVPDRILGEAVAAAVVLKEGASFDENEIRNFLMTKLARFKIPSYFFIYEKLPALANGKVDAVSLKKELTEKLEQKG